MKKETQSDASLTEETIEFEVERLLVESSTRRGTVLRRRAKVKSK